MVFLRTRTCPTSGIAKRERIRLSERVHAGLKRARAKGKVLGRLRKVVRLDHVHELRESAWSVRQIAQHIKVSPMTIYRILLRPESCQKGVR